MAKRKKEFISREDQEKGEGLPEQNVQVPEARFQNKQQTPDVADADKTAAENTGFNKKKVESKGSVLKQEVAARVIDTGLGGDVPETAVQSRGLSYSGNEGVILASAAYTPMVGQSRSDSRTGKKLDAVAKKLNFVPSEQVEEEYDESKPLAENKDAVQGYNGTPRNTNARTQKNNGAAPAELLFQRSVDEIKRDQIYFTTGQVVKQSGIDYKDTPTLVPVYNSSTGIYEYPVNDTPNYSLTRGNYLHRAMRVKFNSQGQVTKMKFDVMENNVVLDNDDIINASSANRAIDANYAEMDRQKMDHKAGDEKADIWTPLARAIKQPTRVVGYLRDIENITGSEIFMAYKKTAACMSYQLNRAAKDGITTFRPMAEAATGLLYAERSSKDYDGVTDVFTTDLYKQGASSLFIALNDSTTKYRTKADLLIQPKAYKLALQTADNNMDPFRLKSDFVKAVNSREVFSTIDREYDPLQPVCISDKAGLMHCYNFNDLYGFDSLTNGNPNFVKTPFSYAYSDLRNSYAVSAFIPLLKGIHEYLNNIGPKLVTLNSGALVNQEIVIPMIHSTCYFSLWSLIVLAATPYIALQRVNALRDVLYYEKNIEYPFHQLITIKEANPMNAVNYGNPDYQLPLVVKRMSPSAALTWALPEVFWPFDEKAADDAYSYVCPWYFNQVDYKFTTDAMTRATGKFAMSMPSVRSGVRFGYLDDIFGMSERDVRLSLDRLNALPPYESGEGLQGVYKYSQNADGIPFVTIKGNQFTPHRFLELPRELGWFIVAPAGVLSKVAVDGTHANDAYIENNGQLFGQTSYVAKYWHGKTPTGAAPNDVLNAASINVDRSSAYAQVWDACAATSYFADNYADWGMLFSINHCFNADMSPIAGKSLFIPFTNGVSNGTNGTETQYEDSDYETYGLITLQKAIWTRIQKLPMALSPFDMILHRHVGEDAKKYDPFDFLYWFGLAGFKASEYDEDVYNRTMDVINKGFTFLSDPWMADSPLFKEAGTYTQSSNEGDLLH